MMHEPQQRRKVRSPCSGGHPPAVIPGEARISVFDWASPATPVGAPGLASETWEPQISRAGAPGLADRGPQRQVLVGGVAETWVTAIYDLRSLVVLGADTTVTLDTHILGKPESAEDAARMLRLLSGRTHRVVTGVALVSATRQQVAAEVTAVQFLTLSERDIQAYIATGEPTDKAGAYAIQGRAARWIPRIEGCYFNVVGLPIALVSTLLEAHSDFSL